VVIAPGVEHAYIKFGRCPPKRNSIIVNSFIIVKVIAYPSFLENPGVLGKELVFLISKRL
jgi:hypothetical protein